jgi:V/A-type H+-transporting ATPase subunit I
MIVEMKKVTLLCLEAQREETLDRLRGLGVLHLVPVRPSQSAELDVVRRRLADADKALEALTAEAKQARTAAPVSGGAEAGDAVEQVLKRIRRRASLDQELVEVEAERAAAEPFGDFSPSLVEKLKERGIPVRLYHAPSRRRVRPPEGAVLQFLREDRTGCHFVVIGEGDIDVAEAREVPIPARSLRDVTEHLARLCEERSKLDGELRALVSSAGAIRAMRGDLAEQMRFLEARDGMGASQRIAYLQGFCPEDGVRRLQSAAGREGWGLVVQDPAPGEAVPTLLRNPRWVRPIRAVFEMIGILPGYEEIDVSPCFLVFFGLFFAMLVGDVGYGLIFLILTAIARRKLPSAPAYPFSLMRMMSVATILWGVLTATYFGISHPPAFLQRFKVQWLGSDHNMMLLCFVIGATHLTVAHLWNAVRGWRRLQALAQLGWIGSTWCMFFLARFLVLGPPPPAWLGPVLAVSAALIIVFMTPPAVFKTEWFNHVMLPLTFVSNFMDVISYVRLYAVGMATVALAMAFNEMAAAQGSSIVGSLAAAVILFLGHALNILLATMGVLVHGIRLNALEFSSHIGISWTGIPYEPFAHRNRQTGEGVGT